METLIVFNDDAISPMRFVNVIKITPQINVMEIKTSNKTFYFPIQNIFYIRQENESP